MGVNSYIANIQAIQINMNEKSNQIFKQYDFELYDIYDSVTKGLINTWPASAKIEKSAQYKVVTKS